MHNSEERFFSPPLHERSVPTTAMKPRSRSVAPAELTVASLEANFEAYLEIMKTRDVSRLMLELRKEISWKCAPKASVLA